MSSTSLSPPCFRRAAGMPHRPLEVFFNMEMALTTSASVGGEPSHGGGSSAVAAASGSGGDNVFVGGNGTGLEAGDRGGMK